MIRLICMLSNFYTYKQQAINLREQGFTYSEIISSLQVRIPKSTLSTWFKNITLSEKAKKRLNTIINEKIKTAHQAALYTNKINRKRYLKEVEERVTHLKNFKKDIDIAKIVLAVLYLGEGAKGKRRAFMLGNSDPKIIRLFLRLMRKCYTIDESKFRCTLQCRADQDIPYLEKYWTAITNIPPSQFYKARIDPRTIGKKSKKPEYKGVCRIDYFSADIYNEIEKIIEIVCDMGL